MKPDWAAIESVYRSGDDSLREIARKFGTVEGTIRSRAKSRGWERTYGQPAAPPPTQVTQSFTPSGGEYDDPEEEPLGGYSGSSTIGPLEVAKPQFVQIVGVTRQSITTWQSEGLPHRRPEHGLVIFHLPSAIAWIRDNKWAQDDGNRLKRIKADDAQLDLDVKLGSLLKAADVEKVWEAGCTSMRARMLSVPQVAQQVLGLTVPQTQSLTGLVHEALEVLSGRMEDIQTEAGDDLEPEKPLPVGQKRRGRKRSKL